MFFFPIFKEKLNYLELPTIEVDSEKYFYRLSNLNFKFKDLIPDHLHIETQSDVHINIEKQKRYGNLGLRITLGPFKVKIEKMDFFLMKRTGIKYNDFGTIDVKAKGAQISFEFILRLEEDAVDNIYTQLVDSDVGSLKIKIRDSRHKVLDKILTTVFLPVIKSKLQKAINEKLYESLQYEVCSRINDTLRSIEKVE